uniref:Uncharacterized protein n=1 Tax=Palpitomonas bilix TaxID=652834 RepID=A0A7S3GI14_9EUKA|mmetsp:Transcript_50304/g.129556  ORF Transcript_50304/g.129556 Transcript_50304/m.129556 type:complete len:529 (+) Transcript_50304:213-1799(+)
MPLSPPQLRTLAVASSASIGVVSLIGFTAQIVFALNMGPVVNFPFFMDIWTCLFSLFFAIQILYLYFKQFSSRYDWRSDLAYYIIAASISVFQVLGAFLGSRWDAGLWGFLLLATVALDIVMIVAKKNGGGTGTGEESGYVHSNKDGHKSSKRSGGRRCLSCFNTFMKILAFIPFAFMLGGTWTQAVGWLSYPPRGTFVKITTDLGVQQDIHVLCMGPINASLPVMILDCGGGGHSMSDLWALQMSLSSNYSRRVCSYDPPGTAWSSYSAPQEGNYLEKVLQQLPSAYPDAVPPYILYGTMDDATNRIYEYALDHPSNVKALIPVQPNIVPEFLPNKIVLGWTEQQMLSYARGAFAGREIFGNVIRAFGVQWGLMSIFAPPNPNYIPQDRATEHAFLNGWNAKQWTTNVATLVSWVDDPSLAFAPSVYLTNRTLASDIPVHVIADKTPNATQTCIDRRQPLTSDNCKIIAMQIELQIDGLRAMSNITASSTLTRCERPTCTGFFAFYFAQNLGWTVSLVMQLIGSITV